MARNQEGTQIMVLSTLCASAVWGNIYLLLQSGNAGEKACDVLANEIRKA